MYEDRRRGGCRPTPEQEWLLKACLLKGEKASQAWQQWRSMVNIELLDQGQRRLLALLYKRLSHLGTDDPALKILKGFYRMTWYKNQMLIHAGDSAVRHLNEAGIPVIILKGAALIAMYYKDVGLRFMSDFDILVPAENAVTAIRLLIQGGWRLDHLYDGVPLGEIPRAYHAANLVNPGGRRVDLHWNLLLECQYPDADRSLWDGSVPVKINGLTSRALKPADQLFHVCVHGARWSPLPPIRWIADALTMLAASGPSMDWDRLVHQTAKRRLVLPLRATLKYLAEIFDAPIPNKVLDCLQDLTPRSTDAIEYYFSTRPPGLLGGLPIFLANYLRNADQSGITGFSNRLKGFLDFLRIRWGLKNRRQVFRRMAKKAWLRLVAAIVVVRKS